MSAAAKSESEFRREVLHRLRHAKPSPPVGNGINDADHILLAQFYNRHVCNRFADRLRRAGIQFKTTSAASRVAIFVQRQDRRQAAKMLEQHLDQDCDIRPKGINREYDATLFLTALTATAALPLMLTPAMPYAVLLLATAITIGMAIGRCHRNRRWYGNFQVSIRELALLVGLVGMLLAAWRLTGFLF